MENPHNKVELTQSTFLHRLEILAGRLGSADEDRVNRVISDIEDLMKSAVNQPYMNIVEFQAKQLMLEIEDSRKDEYRIDRKRSKKENRSRLELMQRRMNVELNSIVVHLRSA